MGRRIVRAPTHTLISPPCPAGPGCSSGGCTSACSPWFSQLASPKDPHPPNLTTKHLLCVLGAVRNICGKPQHFLVLMTSCCVLVPSFRERSSSGASSRSKYLKEPRHIPEAIRETFKSWTVLYGSRDIFPAILFSSGTGLPGPGLLPLRLPYQCTSSTAFSRVDRNVNVPSRLARNFRIIGKKKQNLSEVSPPPLPNTDNDTSVASSLRKKAIVRIRLFEGKLTPLANVVASLDIQFSASPH